jgi:phosphate transport system substrate-binding protein
MDIRASSSSKSRFSRKWIIPVTLILLALQGLTLLWIYKLLPMWKLEQSKQDACITSGVLAKNHSTYLQICKTMMDVLNVPNGQFFYGGTMGAAALRSESFRKEIELAHPNFRLRYLDPLSIPPDSTTGIKMLLDGELSFAESQRPLRDIEYQQAKDRGFTLRQIPVAMTGAAFYVHPGLDIKGLSLAQLQGIYTGEFINWSELGGADLPIVPVSQDINLTGSTLSLLLRDLQSDRQILAETLQQVRDTTAAIRKVAATPGAIGFGTQALVANQHSIRLVGLAKGVSRQYIQPVGSDEKINKSALQDGSYPLIQRIFVIIRQDGSLEEMAGTAYANLLLSTKGQTLIDQAGYLPLKVDTSVTKNE